MKKNLLILLYLLAGIKTYAQDTIISHAYQISPTSNFEDRDKAHYFHKNTIVPNNIWQIGKPSKTIFNAAYSPSFALVTDTMNAYPINNHSSFEFVINTDDETHISFWHRYNTDSLSDGGTVEVSTDNGTTWRNVLNSPPFFVTNFYSTATISSNMDKPGFTGNSGWKKSTISSPGPMHYVRFRFTFTSDDVNTNKEGWMLDNFVFSCLGTGIKETKLNSPFHLFPNPTSDLVSIGSDSYSKINRVEVKNILGKTMLTTDQSAIDLSSLNSGWYFIEINSDKGKFVERVQKN